MTKERASLTVILNLWKRDHLSEQLNSLRLQKVLPKEVWIIQYQNHFEIATTLREFNADFKIETFSISKNLKYFGRYALANFVRTKYVWVLDDDIIPGLGWTELCIHKCKKYKAIIACSGRLIPEGNYEPEAKFDIENFIGDCSGEEFNFSESDVEVDFGIQSYFLKTTWLRYFWRHYPATFESGEDIHLAATLKVVKGIRSIVPRQTSAETTGNLRLSYGFDEHASWRKSRFIGLRKKGLHYLIDELEWLPLRWKLANRKERRRRK
ncbi:MAG TPA: glycosyltransferase family A protein [Chryseosolibacter sp.]